MKSQTDINNMNTGNNLNQMEKSGSINMIPGQSGEADIVIEGDKKEITEESEDIPPEKIPDKNTGFQIYKNENENAKQIEENIINTTTELKKLKDEARTLGEEGNKFKLSISGNTLFPFLVINDTP